MMKKIILMLVAVVVLVGCGKEEKKLVDLERCVELELNDEWVSIGLRGIGDGNGNRVDGGDGIVRGEMDEWAMIEIGDYQQYVRLDDSLRTYQFDMWGGESLWVYGSVVELDCSGVGLTKIRVMGNDVLRRLNCTENYDLTTSAIDELYCSLPDRVGLQAGELYILSPWEDEDELSEVVRLTNGKNAKSKNWHNGGWVDLVTVGEHRCEF